MLPGLDNYSCMFYICSMSGVHIIWFRRDLRVHDHAALKAVRLASERDGGRVLALYIAGSEDAAFPHLDAALRDLDHALAQRDTALHFRTGDAIECLSEIHAAHRILSLHSHDTLADDDLDRQVEAWSLRAGVPFRIHAQFGSDRHADWAAFMSAPRHEAPSALEGIDVGLGHKPYLTAAPDAEAEGGRKAAIQLLRRALGQVSDLEKIGTSEAMSGDDVFKTLEPHLHLGVLSVREVWQAAISAQQQFVKVGHDIRAARVARLIARLSELQPRGTAPHAAGRSRGVPKPQSRGSQLSLDIFPTHPG